MELSFVYHPVCMIYSAIVAQKILGETRLMQTLHLELETKLRLVQTALRVAVLPAEFSECLVAGKCILLTWLPALTVTIAFVLNSLSTSY